MGTEDHQPQVEQLRSYQIEPSFAYRLVMVWVATVVIFLAIVVGYIRRLIEYVR